MNLMEQKCAYNSLWKAFLRCAIAFATVITMPQVTHQYANCADSKATKTGIAVATESTTDSESSRPTEQIPDYDDVRFVLSKYRGKLVRVTGRLTSLVISRNGITYGIITPQRSSVFVRGPLPAKYRHTGVKVCMIARVPQELRTILTLELVRFESPSAGPKQPKVKRSTQSSANVMPTAQVKREHNIATGIITSAQQPYMSNLTSTPNAQSTQAVPIYSAWRVPPSGISSGTAPQQHANPALAQRMNYRTAMPLMRGTLPSRGISYLDRRQLYAHAPYPSRTTPRGSLQWLPWGISANNAKGYPVPSQYTRGVNTPSAFPMTLTRINEQVQQLLPAYKLAALYFNPRLSDQQATQIAQALLYYSILYGVDPRFVTAVIAVESRFRPDAVGKKGEMGLGQLMPGTAKSLGITDPFNPVRNVEGCVRLLARYLLAYSYLPVEQQIALTLAAYNAGPNAVAKYGGVPPYPTTQRYIRKVIQLYKQLCGMQ